MLDPAPHWWTSITRLGFSRFYFPLFFFLFENFSQILLKKEEEKEKKKK